MKLTLFREKVRVRGHHHLCIPKGWPYDEYMLTVCCIDGCDWFRWETA